jgi:hypothetical protein
MTKLERLLAASIVEAQQRRRMRPRGAAGSRSTHAPSLVCLDGNKGGMTMSKSVFTEVVALAKAMSEYGRSMAGSSLSVCDASAQDTASLMIADRGHKITSQLVSPFGGEGLVYETVTAKLHGIHVSFTHVRVAVAADYHEHAAKMRKVEVES